MDLGADKYSVHSKAVDTFGSDNFVWGFSCALWDV